MIEHVIKIALGIGLLEVDRGRQRLIAQRQHTDAGLQAARTAKQVAGHGFRRTHGHLLGPLACAGSSLRVESAFMAANPPMPMGVMVASAPPQIIISAAPHSIILKESPTACAEAEHAVAVAEFGPRAP